MIKKSKATTKLTCPGRTVYAIVSTYGNGIRQWRPKGKKVDVPALFHREEDARACIEAEALREYNYLINEGEEADWAQTEADYIRENWTVVKHEIFKGTDAIPKIRKRKGGMARPAAPVDENEDEYW